MSNLSSVDRDRFVHVHLLAIHPGQSVSGMLDRRAGREALGRPNRDPHGTRHAMGEVKPVKLNPCTVSEHSRAPRVTGVGPADPVTLDPGVVAGRLDRRVGVEAPAIEHIRKGGKGVGPSGVVVVRCHAPVYCMACAKALRHVIIELFSVWGL